MEMQDLTKMNREQLIDYIAQMKAAPTARITFKVSEKGCVSMYGLNMRGIHLYASQWLRVLDNAAALRAFIEANRNKLAWKPVNGKAEVTL